MCVQVYTVTVCVQKDGQVQTVHYRVIVRMGPPVLQTKELVSVHLDTGEPSVREVRICCQFISMQKNKKSTGIMDL